MAIHRTAHGVPVDMAALTAKNEKIRAVGNMNVNARGDVLDSNNKIIKDNTKRVKNNYSKTVNERPETPQINKAELTPEEQMFEDEDVDFTKEPK
jgi:uncharacterized membrane protein YukC